MYRVQTMSKYLFNESDRLQLGDRLYNREEIDGFRSAVCRIIVTDTETRERSIFEAGEVINLHPPSEVEEMTKDEIRALMPDKKFPKNITKTKLLEAYYGRC